MIKGRKPQHLTFSATADRLDVSWLFAEQYSLHVDKLWMATLTWNADKFTGGES